MALEALGMVETRGLTAAIEAAANICKANNHKLAASGVIASPCEEVRKLAAKSAKRLQK